MQSRAFPLIGAAACGFIAAAIGFNISAPRPASAQFQGTPVLGQPLGQINVGPGANTAEPQPIAIQALDPKQFVVVTREPRLVMDLRRGGAAQNMLLPVVTHYTVREDRLVPMEHVHVPLGYRLVTVGE